MRPGCGSLRSDKWFLVAHSPDTVLKAASITSEWCSSNSGNKTKAKPCHETQTPASVSLPVLLHIYFHDSLHYFKVFCLKDGLKCTLPSLQFILPATWPQHTPRTSGCSALCHGYYYFLHFAQMPLHSKPQVDLLPYGLQEFERIPFSRESNVQHFQWAPEGPQVPQQKSLSLVQFLLWAEV